MEGLTYLNYRKTLLLKSKIRTITSISNKDVRNQKHKKDILVQTLEDEDTKIRNHYL